MRVKQYKMLFYNNVFLYNLNVRTQLDHKNQFNCHKMEYFIET
jgi:hypothetical protein